VWLKKEIYFLETVKEKWLFLAIIFLFGVLFINLFEPFNIYSWTNFKHLNKNILLSLYILPLCGGILFTQFFLRRFFKKIEFTILKLGLWILLEILIVTSLNLFFFGDPNMVLSSEFSTAMYHTSLGMLLCYFASFSILQFITKKEFYRINKEYLIAIKDANNKTKITLDHNLILYVKSIENYIQIFYLLNDTPKSILIRNTMKTIETALKPYNILRTQRSYLVNKNQISSIDKENKKFNIHVKKSDETIPLSTTFIANFHDIFVEKK